MEDEIQSAAIRLKSAQQRVERINLIESEYLLAMRRAELKWVRGLIAELQSGSLTWDMKKIFREVRAERRTAAAAKEKSK